MLELSPELLASACADALASGPVGRRDLAAVAVMYEPDPAAPTVLVFPLSTEAIESRRAEARDLRDVLNPAEHVAQDSTVELSLSDEVESRLPVGGNLHELVDAAVALLRVALPDVLVYLTDPECTELAASVRTAPVPASLRWLVELPDLSAPV